MCFNYRSLTTVWSPVYHPQGMVETFQCNCNSVWLLGEHITNDKKVCIIFEKLGGADNVISHTKLASRSNKNTLIRKSRRTRSQCSIKEENGHQV